MIGPDHDDTAAVDGDDWPMCENVLRSLSEDVRPTTAEATVDDDAVASDVRRCLAERVAPTAAAETMLWRQRPHWWRRWPKDDTAVVAAARRTQVLLMAVPSTCPVDGKYYAPETSYVSRTVEELCLEPWAAAATEPPANGHTYTAGTVHHDHETGACHLHGFADPQARVAVDCGLLSAVLPRHRSTVKMYSTLRAPPPDRPGPPVLVPHHFQAFSRGLLFR